MEQLEADYGKTGMQKIITTVGNVVSGSARAKETNFSTPKWEFFNTYCNFALAGWLYDI